MMKQSYKRLIHPNVLGMVG